MVDLNPIITLRQMKFVHSLNDFRPNENNYLYLKTKIRVKFHFYAHKCDVIKKSMSVRKKQ